MASSSRRSRSRGPPREVGIAMPNKLHSEVDFDPYHGFTLDEVAKVSATWIKEVFKCPDYSTEPKHDRSPSLVDFITSILRRAKPPLSVPFATLYLLDRIKRGHPVATGSSGHRLFLSAFIIAQKEFCDTSYSNQSFSDACFEMFPLREVNQLERELLKELHYHIDIDPRALKDFARSAWRNFRGLGPYIKYIPPSPPPAPLRAPSPPPVPRASSHSVVRVASHSQPAYGHAAKLIRPSVNTTTAMRSIYRPRTPDYPANRLESPMSAPSSGVSPITPADVNGHPPGTTFFAVVDELPTGFVPYANQNPALLASQTGIKHEGQRKRLPTPGEVYVRLRPPKM